MKVMWSITFGSLGREAYPAERHKSGTSLGQSGISYHASEEARMAYLIGVSFFTGFRVFLVIVRKKTRLRRSTSFFLHH